MDFLLKHRKWTLIAGLLVTAFFVFSLRNFKVAFSFDAFRPPDAPELEYFEHFSDSFPTHENTILVAFRGPDGNVWNREFLRTVDSAFTQLSQLPFVDTVVSPTRLQYLSRSGMGVRNTPLIPLDSINGLEVGQRRVAESPMLSSVFFSEDGEYVLGTIQVNPSILDAPQRDSLSHAIRSLVEQSGLPHMISGVPYIRTQYVEMISKELGFFLGIAVFLGMIVMWWLFRSWWGVLLPFFGVGAAMLWTFGLMAATGHPLDIIGELLPTVLFVSGISDIVHLVTRYQTDLHEFAEPRQALQASLKEIGGALLLTCLTTAIGFVTLYTSPLPPIRNFGLFAAAGVIFAWIAVMVFVPQVLLRIPATRIRDSRGASNNPRWTRMLPKLYTWVKGRGKWIFAVTGVISVLSIYGMTLISFDTYLLDDVSPQDPTRANIRFFEEHFYGARSFEIGIHPKQGYQMTDIDLLRDLDTIQTYLRTQTRMSPFISTVNYLKGANQVYRGGNPRFYRLPSRPEQVEELLGMGYSAGGRSFIRQTMTPSRSMGRMGAKIADIGSAQFQQIHDSLDAFVGRVCQPPKFDFHLTGLAVINEANAGVLRKGLFEDLIMAVGMIALLMGIMFRNWKMALVAMIPNIIPLVVTAGMMGFSGITLRPSTSIVFLVAFGIATDDTIHFMSRFLHELKAGRDQESAIYNATTGTGKAMLVAALILLAGFGSLMTSDFGGTYVIGLFTTVTLVVAIFADLLLLPALIRLTGIGPKAPSPGSEASPS